MPRGSFAAALQAAAKPEAELRLLRKRVASLEAYVAVLESQLRSHGLEPSSPERSEPLPAVEQAPGPDAELLQLLGSCRLEAYADAFARLGFWNLDHVRNMRDDHMKDLGLLPGDALRLKLKLQEESPAGGASEENTAVTSFQPGIYRCVHAPLVAIRAAPSRSSKVLLTLRTGDLVRISQTVNHHWGRLDDAELWARWTNIWPTRPSGSWDEDPNPQEESQTTVPEQAFVLIEGSEAGIEGALLERLEMWEAEAASWQFRAAQEDTETFPQGSAFTREPSQSQNPRGGLMGGTCCSSCSLPSSCQVQKPLVPARVAQVVETAKRYIGKPYAKCYHDPSDARCMPGSELPMPTSFVSDVGLLEHVIHDLRGDFGFLLHVNCRPAQLYHMLQRDLTSIGEAEPGDLIFYETYDVKAGGSTIVHVEIFAGGSASVGSLPWSASPRTGGMDGVQLFDNYDVEELGGRHITALHVCSIDSLLEANVCPFIHGCYVRQMVAS